MATTCAVTTAQGIATAACIAGLGLSQARSILTSPDFFALRRNKAVFTSITTGTLSCIVYLTSAMHGYVVPTQFYNMPLAICWYLYSYCLYVILLERTIPLIKASFHVSQTKRQLLRFGGAFVLDLPQLITIAVYLHIESLGGFARASPSLLSITSVLIPIGTYVVLLSNASLSFLFVKTLAQHRKQSIQTFIRENRHECGNLLINFVVSWIFLVVKIAGTITLLAAPALNHIIFAVFHNFYSPIIVLNAYSDYLYVTTKVPKQLLSIQIDVTEKDGSNTKKNAGAVSTKLSNTIA